MIVWLELLGALVLLVLAADAFTNGVEWVGVLYGLTRSAAGAVVAAIGSSLPETVVAAVAFFILRDPDSQAVGIGAVIGAPFMLATAVFGLIGITAMVRRMRRGDVLSARMPPVAVGLGLFALTMTIVLAASHAPTTAVRSIASAAVIGVYFAYLIYHLRVKSVAREERPPPLRFSPRTRPPSIGAVLFQFLVAAAVTAIAAYWFVTSVVRVSAAIGISPLLVSIVLSPIASELPEALNVSLWMRRGLDELAVGNVLGAMMFQTSIASAMAMLATPWRLDMHAYAAAGAALVAVFVVLAAMGLIRRLGARALAACGLLYVAYLAFAISTR